MMDENKLFKQIYDLAESEKELEDLRLFIIEYGNLDAYYPEDEQRPLPESVWENHLKGVRKELRRYKFNNELKVELFKGIKAILENYTSHPRFRNPPNCKNFASRIINLFSMTITKKIGHSDAAIIRAYSLLVLQGADVGDVILNPVIKDYPDIRIRIQNMKNQIKKGISNKLSNEVKDYIQEDLYLRDKNLHTLL